MVFFSIFFLSIPAYSVTCEEEPDDPDCTVTLPDTQVIGDDIGSGGGNNDGGWINPWDNGNTGGGSGQAQRCHDLNQDSPNIDDPGSCVTDPGNADEIDYSQWITDNLGRILGGLNVECPNNQGCFYPNNYPNIDNSMVQEILSMFAISFFQNYDYIDARNEILNILIQPCTDNYWANPDARKAEATFNMCIDSQLGFFYSMVPSQQGSVSSWLGSVSIAIPWTGIRLGFGAPDDITPANWVADLLTKVESDRRCHDWYEALEGAGCTAP